MPGPRLVFSAVPTCHFYFVCEAFYFVYVSVNARGVFVCVCVDVCVFLSLRKFYFPDERP